MNRAWESSVYDVLTDTLHGITQPVDVLPPSMANDMPTIRADAWKVGISRHQEVGPSDQSSVLGKSLGGSFPTVTRQRP